MLWILNLVYIQVQVSCTLFDFNYKFKIGTMTCEKRPGSLGYELIDAQTYAEWGVDFLKYDNCFNKFGLTRKNNIDRYTSKIYIF